jgi:hypothetical protein
MIIGWEQEFEALAKHDGHVETAAFKVQVEIEGPDRDMMTDVDPLWEQIDTLSGSRLYEKGMRSTAEGLALYVADLVRRHLEGTQDTLRRVRVVQDGVLWVDV